MRSIVDLSIVRKNFKSLLKNYGQMTKRKGGRENLISGEMSDRTLISIDCSVWGPNAG